VSHSRRRLPLSIVTGFLGSGMTTLLRRVLANPEIDRSCVLVNEMADIGVDHRLLHQVNGSVLLLKNGCVCRSVRDDLREALLELVEADEDAGGAERIIVETTGMANPAPMIKTIVSYPILNDRIRINGVLTLVDCANAESSFNNYQEYSNQIAAADQIVLTKCDLVADRTVEVVLDIVRGLNPYAGINFGDDQRVIEFLQNGEGSFDAPYRALPHRARAPKSVPSLPPPHSHLESFCISLEETCEWTAFAVWLSLLIHAHGNQILRVKGLLCVNPGQAPVAINCVQNLVYFSEHLDEWPDADRRSILVFIVRALDPANVLRSLRTFLGTDRPILLPRATTRPHFAPELIFPNGTTQTNDIRS
jgi:G3E family GTPase